MEPFTNEVLDISSLPKHEVALITPIDQKYWKVVVINFLISFFIFGIGIGTSVFLISELKPYSWLIVSIYVVIMIFLFFIQRKSFKNRGYSIRELDIIYRRGVMSTLTTVIPFNRIQNVAINEGFISRYYGLAQLQVFTAGGATSDIRIAGLLKNDAEKIKELIMQQIVRKEDGHENKIAE